MAVEFQADQPLKTLKFQVSAMLEFGSSLVSLTGFYSTEGDYLLSATFEHLSFDGLSDVFNHFFDDHLTIPDIDIFVGAATAAHCAAAMLLASSNAKRESGAARVSCVSAGCAAAAVGWPIGRGECVSWSRPPAHQCSPIFKVCHWNSVDKSRTSLTLRKVLILAFAPCRS